MQKCHCENEHEYQFENADACKCIRLSTSCIITSYVHCVHLLCVLVFMCIIWSSSYSELCSSRSENLDISGKISSKFAENNLPIYPGNLLDHVSFCFGFSIIWKWKWKWNWESSWKCKWKLKMSYFPIYLQFVKNKSKKVNNNNELGRKGGPSPSTKGRIQSPPPFVNAVVFAS